MIREQCEECASPMGKNQGKITLGIEAREEDVGELSDSSNQ